ncbi:metallophosphoesterase [Actinoplanes sp. NPDC051851]|uniref:metallophosphoesterase n=1 Tax=Actinoplanes sp. NPDC051851 TaxID=3154753 RepID=UPI0034279840
MAATVAYEAVVQSIVAVLHGYLWWRFVRDTSRSRRVRRIGAWVAGGLSVMTSATLIGISAGHLKWLAWPGYVWIGLFFYLLLALVIIELPRWGLSRWWVRDGRTGRNAVEVGDAAEEPAKSGGVERRLVVARGAAIVAGLTAAGVTGHGMRTAFGAPRIDRIRIPIGKLPRTMDGTRLAVVSDIHLGPLNGIGHTERITRVINSVDADVVCVVGDLVDGTVAELGRLAEPLRGIESRRGTYFVTGNHEYYSGYAPWIEEVAQLGMRPLRNERVEIDGLDLAGVNDLGGAEFGDPADFGRALGDRDTTRPVVLMAHQPAAAVRAAPYGVDLQVSGHTHGGQMAPVNLVERLRQPVVSGFGRVDGVPVYVTNGAGFWGPPVRVGAPPQVTVVELRVA